MKNNMVEIKSEIIKQFIYKKDYNYVVYIKETINTFEAYLQNEDYGVIDLMFGVNKKAQNIEDFISYINCNIEDYIEDYKQEHEDQ